MVLVLVLVLVLFTIMVYYYGILIWYTTEKVGWYRWERKKEGETTPEVYSYRYLRNGYRYALFSMTCYIESSPRQLREL